MKDDAWFAGFTDGEGSFGIPKSRATVVPTFSIGLRADDIAVLEQLHAAFGGRLYFRPARGPDNPSAFWAVTSKRDLTGLVQYFDRFPLRAKKARDYAIWRRAALAYCAHGSRAPELWPLREALMTGRKYKEDGLDEFLSPPESPQLRLVG